MRAPICDAEDQLSLDHFAAVLREFCAVQVREGWGIGVTVREYRIGDQALNVFRDSWSIDIEGPDAIVKGILEALQRRREADSATRDPWSRPA